MKHPSLAAFASLILLTVSLSAAEPKKTTLSGPFSHENLDVYLIHGDTPLKGVPILTLGEAIQQKQVIVHETSDVGELKIENLSKEKYVYIHSGDIVKGGKQDRTLPNGFLLAPMTKPVPLESFCVEQGRWANRGKESVARFNGSHNSLSGNNQKLAAKVAKSQSEVWKEVAVAQSKLSTKLETSVNDRKSASSLQLTLENKKLKKTNQAYRSAISSKAAPESKADVVGFAFAINGKFVCSDAFTSRELFLKMWPKLLEAASTEAISEAEKGKTFPRPSKEQILAAIKAPESGKKLPLKQFAGGNQLDTRYVKEAIFFETAALVQLASKHNAPTAVHFNVLSKDSEYDPTAAPAAAVRSNTILNRRQRQSTSPEVMEQSPPAKAEPAPPKAKPVKKKASILKRLFKRG